MRSLILLLFILNYSLKLKTGKYDKPLTFKRSGNTTLSPMDRGLLNSTVLTPQALLDDCLTSMYPVQRTFSNKVMAFVTPTSKYGYKLAIKNRGKLNIVSPAWYTLRSAIFYMSTIFTILLCLD